jgi:hypothetical protein
MIKKSILNNYGIPDSIGATFFSFCLVLTLAPYFPNSDFGIFKVPSFPANVVSILKTLGPISMIGSLMIFVPFLEQEEQKSTDNSRTKAFQLPIFEIGKCTDINPMKMSCSGEIIGGIAAASRVVDEIILDTKPSDIHRFDVQVTAIEYIKAYIREQEKTGSLDREVKHKLRMALLDWEKHVTLFKLGVEITLWNGIFRESANINGSETVAQVICGLSPYCFHRPTFPTIWSMWYVGEQDTLLHFGIPDDFKSYMEQGYYEAVGSSTRRKGLHEFESYTINYFSPNRLAEFVFPKLLIFVVQNKIDGASEETLNKYLDISQWRWSIDDPRRFPRWG